MIPQIKIFGPIGDPEDGTPARMFDEALSQYVGESEVDVLINSQGGSVSEGTAIADAIRSFAGKVNTIITGGACSIAGYIACSGTGRRIIRKKGMLHIHGPQQRTEGNLQDHEDSIEELKHATKQMGEHYAKISGQKFDDIVADFHRDRFYDADQAVDLGFMTEIEDTETVTAMRGYQNIKGLPRQFATAWSKAKPNTPDEDNQMAVATIEDLETRFRGASAEFLVKQMKAKATIESATAAYVSELEAKNATLKSANADLKTEMEAMDDDDDMTAMDDKDKDAMIAELKAEIKAMKTEAMDDDEMDADYDDDMEAMDDDEMEAMDDEMEAMDDKAEMDALRAEVKALKSKGKKTKKRKRHGAKAVRTSTRSRGPSRKSAAAIVDIRVKEKMAADSGLSKRDAAMAVYKEDPALRERRNEEAQG